MKHYLEINGSRRRIRAAVLPFSILLLMVVLIATPAPNFAYSSNESPNPAELTDQGNSCELYPIALSNTSLEGKNPGDLVANVLNGTKPGNFGWLTWTGKQKVKALSISLTSPGDSYTYLNPNDASDHELNVGDWVRGRPGVSNSKLMRNALDRVKYVEITVPVWDEVLGKRAKALYHITGFAKVRIDGYKLTAKDKISVTYLGEDEECLGGLTQPVANDDTYDVNEDQVLVVPSSGVLANDLDPNDDPLTASLVTETLHGDLVLRPDGSFTYKPAANYFGHDSFTYAASDGQYDSNVARANITVLPVNDPPTATADAYEIDQDKTLDIVAPGVLRNDNDIENDPLNALLESRPVHGTLILIADGSFTYTPNAGFNGADSFKYVANDGGLNSAPATVNITVREPGQPGLPPDPATVAPPLDGTVATTLSAATEFLYTGENPIQTGVEPGTITPERTAVIRGMVMTRDEEPLPGVTITILDHPEFGQTLSRADGLFDLVVNGGGLLTVNYEKEGFLPAQRQVQTPWQDYVWVEDAVLIGLDSNVAEIDLSAPDPMQVAQGSVITDEDGTRQATLLIPQGTTAELVMPDGTVHPITTLNVRATEYSVGDEGPLAMPAELPCQSGYTYAVELSADEAIAAGASDVQFSQPLYSYVENFLNLPVGGIVPAGYYDRDQGAWIPSPNGRIIAIVSITNGRANVDTDGDGVADSGADLGITDAERQELATLYTAGQSLWRVPVAHFTPWDYNWPYGPDDEAEEPDQPDPDEAEPDTDYPSCQGGSIIECESQTLREGIPIAGTAFTLYYGSDRVPSRTSEYTVDIPLSGARLPDSLKRIELEVKVAGRQFNQTFAAVPYQKATFTWDGLNAYGRDVQGSQPISTHIGYVYNAVYMEPAQFNQAFGAYSGVPISGSRARQEVELGQDWQGSIGTWDAKGGGLGGWNIDEHYSYDVVGRVLYTGNGSQRRVEGVPNVITTVAGRGVNGYSGDGGPAIQASLRSPYGVVVGPDRNLYIADRGNNRIRRVEPNGIITTVAGNGGVGYSGDGGPATQASLSNPGGIAVGLDHSLYIADTENAVIRRVGPDGIITTVAGTGEYGYSGDGGLATHASLLYPSGIAIGPDNSLYIADTTNNVIRRVGPDGIITTVAGTGEYGYSGDGGPATQAKLGSPNGVAVGSDNSLYIADSLNNVIRRVGPDGIITTVAGTGEYGYSGDGGPATQAKLSQSDGIVVGLDNSLYIADSLNNVIRRVGPGGIITTVAGNGMRGYSGDEGPATQAKLSVPYAVAVGPDSSLYIADPGNQVIRRVGPDGIITTVAGNGMHGYSGDGSPATQALLDHPSWIAVGPDHSFYIADSWNQVIRRVGPDGIITTAAGNGDYGYSGDGGPATQASLWYPSGLAVGPDNSLYIADSWNQVIRRVGPDGIISTVAGNGDYGYSGDGGLATQASFRYPSGVAIGPDNSLYIADLENQVIRRVGPDGIVTTVAGNGVEGYSGDGGPATQASLFYPVSLAVGLDCCFYIVDQENQVIRRVGPDGIITTVAGNGNGDYGYSGDGGLATEASLGYPAGIAVGPDNSLYIADSLNHVIRRVGPDRIITTVAGNGVEGSSGDGRPATQDTLRGPSGVAVGPVNSLYIADTGNSRIRQVAPSLAGISLGQIVIPSEDGQQLHVFETSGRHLRTINALTNAILYRFTYDSDGRLSAVIDGDGNTTTIERDANGQPTAIVAPFGQRTELRLDANGYLDGITNPAGETTSFTYTAGGLMTSLTDARGGTHTFGYDGMGRLIRDEDPRGGSKTLSRAQSDQGYTVTVTAAEGGETSYSIERRSVGGLFRRTTGPDGTQTETTIGTDGGTITTLPDGTVIDLLEGPDPRFGMLAALPSSFTVATPGGKVLTTTTVRTVTLANPEDVLSLTGLTDSITVNGRIHTTHYDAANRTYTYTSPEGRIHSTTIDDQGRVVLEQTTGLEPIAYAYDARGRLSTITQGTGAGARITRFTYNAQGYLQTIVDPLDQTVRFEYDAAGRVTQQILADGRVIAYAYDDNGNLTSLTPPGQPGHAFAYNAVDLAESYNPPGVGLPLDETHLTYDLDRQVTRIALPTGQNMDFTYNPTTGNLSSLSFSRGTSGFGYSVSTGLLMSLASPGGISLAFTYDGTLLMQESWSGPVAGTVGRTYDNDLRITVLRVNGGSAIAYQYDADGLLTEAGDLTLERDPQNGLLTGTTLGSVDDSWAYNGFGEPETYAATYEGNPIYDIQYTRDALGRITGKTETIGGVTDVYAYDYDPASRLLSVEKNGVTVASYTYDSNGNRLSHTSGGNTVTGRYDDQDRLLQYGTATYTYTADGRLLAKTSGGQTTGYQIDELGNLMSVSLPDGTQIAYLVDGNNRRIGRKVNGALVQGWLYQDDLNPIAELDGTGDVVARFIYGSRPNAPDYMVKDGTIYRFIPDHLGSPRLVINIETGEIVQRLDYDEFGRVVLDTNPGFQPFGFAGGLYDAATGLLRFGAREYDPVTGRWLSKDPMWDVGNDANQYAYVGNDPINWIDPDGKGSMSPMILQSNVSYPPVSTQTMLCSGPDSNTKTTNILKWSWKAVRVMTGRPGPTQVPTFAPNPRG